MAMATLALWAMYQYNWSFSWWKISLEGIDLLEGAIVTITILTGLSVVVEGMLIRCTAKQVITPRIENTKRGMQAIVYRSRNVWVLPIFFIIPGNSIPSALPYWYRNLHWAIVTLHSYYSQSLSDFQNC